MKKLALKTVAWVIAVAAGLAYVFYSVVVVRAGWAIATQPASDVGTTVAQTELLGSTVGVVLQPLLLVATLATAMATWLTVREMRAGRDQERQLNDERRRGAADDAVRHDAWLLIGIVYATAGTAATIGATLQAASRFGRVRRSIEQPMMQTAFSTTGQIAEGTAAALRLQDVPGAWGQPARELSDLLLELASAMTDARHSQAVAEKITEPVQRLRDALPGRARRPGR